MRATMMSKYWAMGTKNSEVPDSLPHRHRQPGIRRLKHRNGFSRLRDFQCEKLQGWFELTKQWADSGLGGATLDGMRRRRPSRDRRGTTLIELAVVLGIVGLVTLLALPSAVRVIDQVELGSARSALVNLYQGTRMSARASNRMTVLRVSQHRIVVERNSPSGAAKDTLSVTDLKAQFGVFLSGPDSIRIDPRGILETKLQTAVTYVLSRGSRSDSLRLTSYGRIVR